MASPLAFIGGGNMAGAILGGLLRAGQVKAADVIVVEPHEAQRDKLRADHGLHALAAGDASLARAGTIVWAVKPQLFTAAAEPLQAWLGGALHLSVMAGIPSASLARLTGSERIVRYAFDLARRIGRKKVTVVHKANILKSTSGLFLKVAREVAGRYPDVAMNEMISLRDRRTSAVSWR